MRKYCQQKISGASKEKRCPHIADYRFTWPGSDESFICTNHVEKLIRTAEALGMHLQVINLCRGCGADRQPSKRLCDDCHAAEVALAEQVDNCPSCAYFKRTDQPCCDQCAAEQQGAK